MKNNNSSPEGHWYLSKGKKIYMSEEEYAEVLSEVERENKAEAEPRLEQEELDALERPVAQARAAAAERVEFRELLMHLNGREF